MALQKTGQVRATVTIRVKTSSLLLTNRKANFVCGCGLLLVTACNSIKKLQRYNMWGRYFIPLGIVYLFFYR